jgi:exodeoxyribonuclease VII small subunit
MNQTSDKLPDFEKALAELEELVNKLESGELSLDDSLSQFKRGVELTRQCQLVLDQAQQSVEKLLNPDDESSAEDFTL